jgi:uncharacterized protein YyaL (SSP411 family)
LGNNSPNRLINEKSPYLLQHAHNPIDWYPWGSEAFHRAGAEDKPILLSIGYSACHWCHEMANQSFSDPKTAETVNKYFIPVKVDREERPDIDTVYMNVCRVLTGQGGWPLNLLLTPSKKPFFAGTYYPKDDMGQYVGFKTILNNAAQAWSSNRQSVVESASKITELINQGLTPVPGEIDEDITDRCADILIKSFDKEYGGFGEAPKFPTPQIIMFLLQYSKNHGNSLSGEVALKTLQKIYEGGLHDHIGGGYFRYCTDEKWMIPHFEKMLYDNALLAISFFEAGEFYRQKATEILSFLQSEMRDPEGVFYSAVSAVSSEGEGVFYLWNQKEISDALGKDSEKFIKHFNIDKKGYFKGKCLPRLTGEPYKNHESDLQKLYIKRLLRPAPDIDKKILSGQNALAAIAFVRAYRSEDAEDYLSIAKKCVDYVDTNMRDAGGRLLASFVDGEGSIPAFADDYTYLLWAFLELYEAGQTQYLESAKNTWLDITKYFLSENGGLYFYASDSEQLIARPMEGYDLSMPSANSVALLCLKKLYNITKDEGYKKDYDNILKTFGGEVNTEPTGFCFMLYALES